MLTVQSQIINNCKYYTRPLKTFGHLINDGDFSTGFVLYESKKQKYYVVGGVNATFQVTATESHYFITR